MNKWTIINLSKERAIEGVIILEDIYANSGVYTFDEYIIKLLLYL